MQYSLRFLSAAVIDDIQASPLKLAPLKNRVECFNALLRIILGKIRISRLQVLGVKRHSVVDSLGLGPSASQETCRVQFTFCCC